MHFREFTLLFQAKICGVRSVDDVDAVADAGGEIKVAVGLNFYPKSVRFLDANLDSTAAVAKRARERGVLSVGVFVNESTDDIFRKILRFDLDAIQLHGDETPELAGEIAAKLKQSASRDVQIIRAISLPTLGLTIDAISNAILRWREIDCDLLLDADAGAARGGVGKCLEWSVVNEWSNRNPDVAWTLAGGLNPGNVQQAIRLSGAFGVDTASGVEKPRGRKSRELIADFLDQASTALKADG